MKNYSVPYYAKEVEFHLNSNYIYETEFLFRNDIFNAKLYLWNRINCLTYTLFPLVFHRVPFRNSARAASFVKICPCLDL